MFALLASSSFAAPCAAVEPIASYRARLGSAAWGSDSAETALHEQLPQLLLDLGCLSEPLTPTDAASVHALVAADASFSGDARKARGAMAAVQRTDARRAADAVAELPALEALLDRQPMFVMGEGFGTSLAARVFVDGVETNTRTVGQPSVVQVFDAAANPIGGAWVDASAPLPPWVAFPEVACTEDVSVEDILRLASVAEASYTALDVPGFESALRGVAVRLPCVSGRIGTAQASAIHRLEGLRQFAHGSDENALRSFQEARGLDPLFRPDPSVVRPETALAALWEQAGRAPAGPWVFQDVPAGLTLAVDGVSTSVRPAMLPAIVQVSDRAGSVLLTLYTPPGAELPDLSPYAVVAARALAEAEPPARRLYAELALRRKADTRQTALLVGSGAAFTASGVLFLVNADAVQEWSAPQTPASRLDSLSATSNAAATGATTSVLVGMGLLAGALLTR